MKAAVEELQLLVVMGTEATADEVDEILAHLQDVGADSRVMPGEHGTVIGAIGDSESLAVLNLGGTRASSGDAVPRPPSSSRERRRPTPR